MRFDLGQLQRAASDSGFQAEPFEKVLHLIDLLETLFKHPYLADRLVLKGGTALNLFTFDLPRLSVDIDLNYIGAVDRETMLDERPAIDQAVRAVCERQGLRVRRTPLEHAGGKWRLSYDRAQGDTGTLELDLNFLLRSPLWRPERWDSPEFLGLSARGIPVLDLHELAGGKLSALFSRKTSRDLFDAAGILARSDIDPAMLRLAFVAYGAMSRRDWRTVSAADVEMEPREATQRLLPLMRSDCLPERTEIGSWSRALVNRCRDLLSMVLPFSPPELEFLERINGSGEIRPTLITDDPRMQERLATHPALLWKAQNVRNFRQSDS